MLEGQRISVSAKAVVVRDDHVLLIRYDEPHKHYNLPGGRLLTGETLREAVTRKLRTECAADGRAVRLLFVYEHLPNPDDPEPGDYQKVQFNFLAELDAGSPEPANPPEAVDQAAVEWVALADLRSVVLYPPVTDRVLHCLGRADDYDPLLEDDPVRPPRAHSD